VSAASLLGYLYLAYLSKPPPYRALYRLIRRHRPRRIVEIGIGDTRRAARMIAVAQRYAGVDRVCYTGIDFFEDGPAGRPSVPLKAAYRLLRATGASIRLEPGDPHWALARAANSLADTDLLLIWNPREPDFTAAAWFYVPRMLHTDTLVLVEEPASDGQSIIRGLSQVEIAGLARGRPRRAAA